MKFSKIFITLAMVLVALTAVSKAQALQLKEAKVSIGDSRGNQPGVSYNFSFVHTSTNTIKKITFDFCKVASGATDDCPNAVATGDRSGASLGSIAAALGQTTDWVESEVNEMVILTHNSTIGVPGDTPITVDLAGLRNTDLTEACDGTAGSDTCYIWIKTYLANGTTILDTGVVTYTIIGAIDVTAKVDPTFTFVVAGVAAGAVNNEITTSVLSFWDSLPFGSLQAGTPKYAAHALTVTTNTQGGYVIYSAMQSPMTGIYAQNNIDPFMAAWGFPTTWTEPTGGTPNTNTGWIGANTTDQDIAQWASGQTPAQKFGAISASPVEVSKKLSSDNGTTPVYVTYAVEANVFQPSDAYRGTVLYNALPTY